MPARVGRTVSRDQEAAIGWPLLQRPGPTRHEETFVKLSIVTTIYRSAATINEFYSRAMKAAEPIADDIEMVMVNDGSPDDSLGLALALHAADPRVVVVDLARNFGHHKAEMAGLGHVT